MGYIKQSFLFTNNHEVYLKMNTTNGVYKTTMGYIKQSFLFTNNHEIYLKMNITNGVYKTIILTHK